MIIAGPNLQTLFRVAQARSTDPTKPTLNCVKLEPFNSGLNVAATDGLVLAMGHLDPGPHDTVADPVACLVPPEILKLMKASHFERYNTAIALEMTEDAEGMQTWSYFAAGAKHSVTRPAVNGRYPRWQKCIPSADQLISLEHLPNHGFSLDVMQKANAVLGCKRYPFQLGQALSCPGHSTTVTQKDGITVLAMPLTFDNIEGSKLAILDNMRQMGFVPAEVLP